eukprot:COSAG02_NODE_6262_length_3696_cov_1.712260_2_plen_106_part_00
MEKVAKLATKAESRGDTWEFAKLAAIASICARRETGSEGGLEWERKAMDALGELDTDESSERRNEESLLELEVGLRLLGGLIHTDTEKYLSRASPPVVHFSCWTR